MSKEVMKLALEALEYIEHNYMSLPAPAEKAITALREALAQDVPETNFRNTALDKMAENARELGLDYEPAQETDQSVMYTYPSKPEPIPCGKPIGILMKKKGDEHMKLYPLAEQSAQQQEIVRVPVTDNTYNYAKSLAEAIFKQHFASDEHYASGRIVWGVNDTVIGILTQIDNMVADMVRRPAQQEPVTWRYKIVDVFGRPAWTLKTPKSDTRVLESQPLYTTTPQRKPLTDEQILAVARGHYNPHQRPEISFARAIEAAHGIKGEA